MIEPKRNAYRLNGLNLLRSRVTNHVTMTFAEPGLNAAAEALSDRQYHLRIQLDHALTPSWHAYPDFPVEINILLNQSQLQYIITELSG